MVISLSPSIIIDGSDGLNWTLKRRVTRKTGKLAGQYDWETLGYYANPEHAVDAAWRKALIESKLHLDLSKVEAYALDLLKSIIKGVK